MKERGTVFSGKGSWGFIEPDDPTRDNIFYHHTDLLDGRKRLRVGEIVEFEIGEFNGRATATNVRVIRAVKQTAESFLWLNPEGSDVPAAPETMGGSHESAN
jgi:cold shock CspA family protein